MFDGNPVKFVDDEIKAYQNNENNEELDTFYKRIKCAIDFRNNRHRYWVAEAEKALNNLNMFVKEQSQNEQAHQDDLDR